MSQKGVKPDPHFLVEESCPQSVSHAGSFETPTCYVSPSNMKGRGLLATTTLFLSHCAVKHIANKDTTRLICYDLTSRTISRDYAIDVVTHGNLRESSFQWILHKT